MTDIALNPSEPARFQPREGGPTYILRVPRVIDRAAFQRQLRMEGGQRWGAVELAETCKAGIRVLLDDPADHETRDRFVAEVDAYIVGVKAALAAYQADRCEPNLVKLGEALQMSELCEEIWSRTAALYKPLARKMADNDTFPQVMGLVSARLFLRGWEGIDAPFRQSLGVVPDDVLDHIPPEDILAIGRRIGELMEPAEAKAKNSASPPSGD